jgi:O-antigen ligase
MAFARLGSTVGLKPDWLVVLLPLAVAVGLLSPRTSPFLILAIGVVAFSRKRESNFHLAPGPLILQLTACAIVLSRPSNFWDPVLTVFLFSLILLQLLYTVDARRIIASIIDGYGLVMVANIVLHAAGLRNPADAFAPKGRTFYPLTQGLNNVSVVAAAVVVGSFLLLREVGHLRRLLRLVSIAAAITVMIGAATRTSAGVCIVLVAAAALLPSTSRWTAQIATLVAASAPFVLPSIAQSLQFLITPLSNLNPGREAEKVGAVSFAGRIEIWDKSINYWNQNINDWADKLFGFGEDGQSLSGVSATYQNIVAGTSANPQNATVHNSFLESLFNCGVVGMVLTVVAFFWTSVRLAKRHRAWGHWGLAATYSLAALMFGATTEAVLSPGNNAEAAWIGLTIVGVSCQVVIRATTSPPTASRKTPATAPT